MSNLRRTCGLLDVHNFEFAGNIERQAASMSPVMATVDDLAKKREATLGMGSKIKPAMLLIKPLFYLYSASAARAGLRETDSNEFTFNLAASLAPPKPQLSS